MAISFALRACVVLISVVPATSAFAQATPTPRPTPVIDPSTSGLGDDFMLRHRNEGFENEFNTKVVLADALSPMKKQELAKSVADCLIRRNPEGVGSLVGGPLTSDEQYGALSKALSRRYSRCVDRRSAGLPMSMVNDLIAEQLVLKENAAMEQRARSVDVTAAEKFYAAPSPTMASLGRCMAVYSPGLARELLSSRPGTDVERAALAALYKQTPECNRREPPADIPVDEQRGAVASGLYLWTHRG